MRKSVFLTTCGWPLFLEPRTFSTARPDFGTPGCGRRFTDRHGWRFQIILGLVIGSVVIGNPVPVCASVPDPGKPVNGLKVRFQLLTNQQQPFRINDAVDAELTIQNVGSQPIIVYQGDWSFIEEKGYSNVLSIGHYEINGAARSFHGLFPLIADRSFNGMKAKKEQGTFIQLLPGGTLGKRIQLSWPSWSKEVPGRFELAVTITMDPHLYEGHLSKEEIWKAWVGSVTSNLVTVEIVK